MSVIYHTNLVSLRIFSNELTSCEMGVYLTLFTAHCVICSSFFFISLDIKLIIFSAYELRNCLEKFSRYKVIIQNEVEKVKDFHLQKWIFVSSYHFYISKYTVKAGLYSVVSANAQLSLVLALLPEPWSFGDFENSNLWSWFLLIENWKDIVLGNGIMYRYCIFLSLTN